MIDILFVDDEPDMLEQAELFLSKEDEEFEVKTAVSGEKALNYLSSNDFDVIVSDYKMPQMDGIGLLKHIRDRNISTPFIILTAAGDEEVAMDALNYGADRYLIKEGKVSNQFNILSKEIQQEVKHYKTRKRLVEAEQRYKDLVKNLPVGIYKTTPEGKIIGGNEALIEMFGFSDIRELKLKDASDLFLNKDDREKWMKEMKEKGIVENFVYRMEKRNGDIIWVEDTARAVKDEEGEIDHYSGILRDITEKKKVEEELGKSKEWLSLTFNILDSFGSPIITTDKKGQIAYVNKYTESLFGLKKEDIVGEYFDDIFRLYIDGTDQMVEDPVQSIIQEDEMIKNGGIFDVYHSEMKRTLMYEGYPITKKSGNIIGTIITFKELEELPDMKENAEISFGELYEEIPHGLVILDPSNYTPTRSNKTVLKYIDMDEGEFERTSVLNWEVEKDASFTYNTVKEKLEKDNIFTTKVKKTYDDGAAKVFSLKMQRFELGSEERILLSMDDVTDSIEETRRVNEKARKYRKAYNSIDEGVVFGYLTYNEKGTPAELILLDINTSFERMMDVQREEVTGRSWSKILFDLDKEALNTIDGVVRAGGTKSFGLTDNRTRDKLDVKVVSEAGNRVILIFKHPYS